MVESNDPQRFGRPPEEGADATHPDQNEDLHLKDIVEGPAAEAAPSDQKTKATADDAEKKEGDNAAAKAPDEQAAKAVVMKQKPWERFKNMLANWWSNPRKRWLTLGVVVFVIAVLMLVPLTRYNLLGLVMKAPVTVRVIDSQNKQPVSGATVTLAGVSAQTDANGKATLKAKAGSKTLSVSKQYYGGYTQGKLVTLSAGKNTFTASLKAQGHRVTVKVVNKLTGKPVAGAAVTVQRAATKSDNKGMATVVIPSGATTQEASLSFSGYNTTKVTIDAAGNAAKNTFSLTPAGKLYFLSNLSGKIDVVKANLDGSDRQTVLAGTGNEDRQTTSLLASRDWKYLVLLAKRSGQTPGVYLIDTTSGDKLTTVDEGDAGFSLVGWSGDRFIYQVTRNSVQLWQANRQALKSFDATTGQTLLLDQTQGTGTDSNNYASQSFGSAYIINDQIVYAKNWNGSYYNLSAMSGKQAELDSIGSNGSGHRTVKTFSLSSVLSSVSIDTVLYEPGGLYIYFFNGTEGSKFYDYEDGKVTADAAMTDDKFYQTPYSTYLLSPSGGKTFWADQRDGKNTLFVGDQDAKGQKQVASLSSYNTYGWFTEDYLLVSKDSSELYIMSTTGGTPYKITDYYKPAITYNGYGGGYGGL